MYATDCSLGTKAITTIVAAADMITSRQKGHDNNIMQLRAVVGLCNAGEFDATLIHLTLHAREINGHATYQAILRFSKSLGPVQELVQMWRKWVEIPFDSQNKLMIRVFSAMDEKSLSVILPPLVVAQHDCKNDMLLTMKCGPGVLIGRCESCILEGRTSCILDNETRAIPLDIKDSWCSQDKRVILFAPKALPESGIAIVPASNASEEEAMKHVLPSLTPVGLVAIKNTPRREIPHVVRTLRRVGIRLFVATGDFKLMAQAIAQ